MNKKVKNVCEVCGKDISNRRNNAKYCLDCSEKVHLEKVKKRQNHKRILWDSLSDQEQQRILQLLAKKMLSGEL